MDPITKLFVGVFLISTVFGAVARKTDFCRLGGVADIMHGGNWGRLHMYFFAIAVAILGITLLEAFAILNLNSTLPPYRI